MLDLTLAIFHHLLVFAIFGVVCAELILVRKGMALADVRLIASIDIRYGALAGAIVAVGLIRAIFAAKGWYYYSHNLFFWAKITTFVLIGLLSVPPTILFVRWRRKGALPSEGQVRFVRRILWMEAVLFAPLLVFAAAMARGYGEMR